WRGDRRARRSAGGRSSGGAGRRPARRPRSARAHGEGGARRGASRCRDGDRSRASKTGRVRLTRFHIVGIGGMGMSAVARLLVARGDVVSGSDKGSWPLAQALAAEGAVVATAFEAAHV